VLNHLGPTSLAEAGDNNQYTATIKAAQCLTSALLLPMAPTVAGLVDRLKSIYGAEEEEKLPLSITTAIALLVSS
jgi:hypothetical protein